MRATTASVENVKVLMELLLLEEKLAGSPVGLCAPLRELTGLPCPCPALPRPGRCQCHTEGAARRCHGRQLSAWLSLGRDHEGPQGCEHGPESHSSAELGHPEPGGRLGEQSHLAPGLWGQVMLQGGGGTSMARLQHSWPLGQGTGQLAGGAGLPAGVPDCPPPQGRPREPSQPQDSSGSLVVLPGRSGP